MTTALKRLTAGTHGNWARHLGLALTITGLALAGTACSKRQPKVDTAAPGVKPSSNTSGGSDNSYIPTNPGSSTTTGGNNNVTPPSNNTTTGGNNNNVTPPNNNDTTPPSNNTTTGGNNNNDTTPPNNNDTTPGGNDSNNNNIVPPSTNNITPQGNSVVTEVEVQVVVEMKDSVGPQVKATVPKGSTDTSLTYKTIAGSDSGTTVTFDLSFKNDSKTCSVNGATASQQINAIKVACR